MSTIVKRGNKYQVQIKCNGVRTCRSFNQKSDAQKWGRKVESDIQRSVYINTSLSRKPLSYLLDLYEAEILPALKGKYCDKYRIKKLRSEMGYVLIANITPEMLRKYRDKRMKQVKAGTVRKELGLISRILNSGEKDFGIMLPLGNPVSKIRMPKVNDARDRRLSPEEAVVIEQIPVFKFAIETAMRRGEIHRMVWSDIDFKSPELLIPITKSDKPRVIPLSTTAVKILKSLRSESVQNISGKVWDIKLDTLSRSFMRLCRNNDFEDLRLHDLRHEATSRFFELGLNPVEVASITGHSDTRMLLRYTHLRAEDLAVKLG